MSDESRRSDKTLRPLKEEERQLLAAMLKDAADPIKADLAAARVVDLRDGGMGSIAFIFEPTQKIRSIGKVISKAEYLDEDGVPVSIAVNTDLDGRLFEVDFWKVDFSPLRRYPRPEQLRLEM